ncbi:hypothetical protein F6V30_15765 [Oryzomonas sagensis]|uniref:Lipoprotein n=1 Tax=Oryzomonas sagensis TaxID=2603857 RepID=A0ABQ6TKF8_9BACT|nr:hypothetical protein [Oryzomonas sagensis]KAB0668556.1 hypothetical protein F6V30_15765 [Oryzomonas sagensis]
MRYLKRLFPCILLVSLLALAGCGGSNTGTNSSASDQFSTGTTGSGSGSGTGTSSAGVIMFTDAASAQPGSQTNMLSDFARTIDPAVVPSVSVLQPIPFKLTDAKGTSRAGVPVTMYVYSITTLNPNDVIIDFLVPTTIGGTTTAPNPEPTQQTITTDSAGMGIFNVATNITSPPVGSFTAVTVVFKAVTNDAVPVTAYVGRSYSLTSNPALSLTPSRLSFAAADGVGATRTFAISGGTPPYTNPNSSNTARVTVSLSGSTTLTATLVDASLWPETVTVSVLDSAGQTASATILRQ